MQSAWQAGVANARLEFFVETQFQIFTQKSLFGNINYFVSFKLKSLMSDGFGENINSIQTLTTNQ